MVKKCKILPRFLTPVTFDAPWYKNGAIRRTSVNSSFSVDDCALFTQIVRSLLRRFQRGWGWNQNT